MKIETVKKPKDNRVPLSSISPGEGFLDAGCVYFRITLNCMKNSIYEDAVWVVSLRYMSVTYYCDPENIMVIPIHLSELKVYYE